MESYSALLLFRILPRRNNLVECLLLSNSLGSNKHWSFPKCTVVGEENVDQLIQETAESLSLQERNINLIKGFKQELKYLSGNKAKQLTIYLAQVPTYVRIIPANLVGIKFEWASRASALEMVFFKSAQDVLTAAFDHVENEIVSSREVQAPLPSTLAVGNLDSRYGAMEPSDARMGSYQARPSSTRNAMYKTRLCEAYRNTGDCPYGTRCCYAHGDGELRPSVDDPGSGRMQGTTRPTNGNSLLQDRSRPLTQQAYRPGHADLSAQNGVNSSPTTPSPLFKTRLCEKFMNTGFCPYNAKCHFAHGNQELRSRPSLPSSESQSPTVRFSAGAPYPTRGIIPTVGEGAASRNFPSAAPLTQQVKKAEEPPAELVPTAEKRESLRFNTSHPMPGRKSSVADEKLSFKDAFTPVNDAEKDMILKAASQLNDLDISDDDFDDMDFTNNSAPTKAKRAPGAQKLHDLLHVYFMDGNSAKSISGQRSTGNIGEDIKYINNLAHKYSLPKQVAFNEVCICLLGSENALERAEHRTDFFKSYLRLPQDQQFLLKAFANLMDEFSSSTDTFSRKVGSIIDLYAKAGIFNAQNLQTFVSSIPKLSSLSKETKEELNSAVKLVLEKSC